MQLFVPIFLQYCRTYSLISRFRISLRSILKLLPLSDARKKNKRNKKSNLLIFFYRQEYMLLLDHTFLYMSDTGQNVNTLLLKCFLRNCKYVYIDINMYTSTFNTSDRYVDVFLLLAQIHSICLLHQLMPLRPSCMNTQWFVYKRDVKKEHCCTDDVILIIHSYCN